MSQPSSLTGLTAAQIDPEAAPALWTTLFNQDRFHALNLRDEQQLLRAEASDREGRLIGAFAGVLEDGTLTNGFSAPFGGLDFSRARETPENVERLVQEALAEFRGAGVRRVRVKLPPACYGENEPLVQFTLLNNGFTVERCELNQHIDLRTVADAEDYVARLKSPARRALKKPDIQHLAFREALDDQAWDAAYTTLEANRAARGRRLSLPRDYIHRARRALGDRVRMFELVDGDANVAAALVYRVRETRDLVVAWGDAGHHFEHSPMNVLALRVVEQVLSEGVVTLDLGISNEHEPRPDGGLVPNRGLVQFKQSVLADVEPRFTLVRELAP